MRHSDDACCGAGISREAVRRGVEARLGDWLPKSAGSRDSRVCKGRVVLLFDRDTKTWKLRQFVRTGSISSFVLSLC